MDLSKLYQLAQQTLINLTTEAGFNASGKNEIYGCIFGRDSALTILKILHAHTNKPNPVLLEISKRTLLTLVSLQGKTFNLESGEEPGKFIHEFRKDKYEHLITAQKPWYLYPEGVLKNYDSVDATPLTLIALYRYWEITQDSAFLITVLSAVEEAINWIITFGDQDKDQLIEYRLPQERKHGGLSVQSWTDSRESILTIDGQMPQYPIAPIEVQAYCWLALKLWSGFYATHSPKFSEKISIWANQLKQRFNNRFIFKDHGLYFGAQALDGNKSKILTITGNTPLCLWASYKSDSGIETIIDMQYIENFVERSFMNDLFVENAGIRTMSALSLTYNPNQDSYHNGSFWPILNSMIIEGLDNFGFTKQSEKLRIASLTPIEYFNTPIELYIKTVDGYSEYCNTNGQTSCKEQAWSAAALLDMTSR